jgi:hypothetical protein
MQGAIAERTQSRLFAFIIFVFWRTLRLYGENDVYGRILTIELPVGNVTGLFLPVFFYIFWCYFILRPQRLCGEYMFLMNKSIKTK